MFLQKKPQQLCLLFQQRQAVHLSPENEWINYCVYVKWNIVVQYGIVSHFYNTDSKKVGKLKTYSFMKCSWAQVVTSSIWSNKHQARQCCFLSNARLFLVWMPTYLSILSFLTAYCIPIAMLEHLNTYCTLCPFFIKGLTQLLLVALAAHIK